MIWTRDSHNKLYYYEEEVGEIGITLDGEMIARISPSYKMSIDLTSETMLQLNQLLESVKLNWESVL